LGRLKYFADLPILVDVKFPQLFLLAMLAAAPSASADDVRNLTGLPAYPRLNSAVMDGVFRTDTLGHWCMRFWAIAPDSLTAVEAWYRRSLAGASEIDLAKDKTYRNFTGLSGIKLAMGIDYVVVYKTAAQPATSIDLYRCSSPAR
jgi:hypothetical protein